MGDLERDKLVFCDVLLLMVAIGYRHVTLRTATRTSRNAASPDEGMANSQSEER